MSDHGGPLERAGQTPSVAVIIPALNEAETVGTIVSTVSSMPDVTRVLVVSDGSSDDTAAVAEAAGAEVLALPLNLGKGTAMRMGWERVEEDVVLFLDADLVGLTPEHVRAMLAPVLDGTADATVGLFEGGRLPTDLAQALAPFLSGQRALRRPLLGHVALEEDAGFGVELAIHRTLKRLGVTVQEVVLQDVSQVLKEEKLGLYKGFAARMKMYWEILRELPRV